jgi:hypothetical protein
LALVRSSDASSHILAYQSHLPLSINPDASRY